MIKPPPIQPYLRPILPEALPETMKRALVRLKRVQDKPTKSPGSYWRRYY